MRAGLVLMLTGLVMWMAAIYFPTRLAAVVGFGPLPRFATVLSGMFVVWIGVRFDTRDSKTQMEASRGFDVIATLTEPHFDNPGGPPPAAIAPCRQESTQNAE